MHVGHEEAERSDLGFQHPCSPGVGASVFLPLLSTQLTSISFLTQSLPAAKISAFSFNGVLVYI